MLSFLIINAACGAREQIEDKKTKSAHLSSKASTSSPSLTHRDTEPATARKKKE